MNLFCAELCTRWKGMVHEQANNFLFRADDAQLAERVLKPVPMFFGKILKNTVEMPKHHTV